MALFGHLSMVWLRTATTWPQRVTWDHTTDFVVDMVVLNRYNAASAFKLKLKYGGWKKVGLKVCT